MPRQLTAGRFFGATLQHRRLSGLTLVESVHPAGSTLPRHSHERAYFCINESGTYVERYARRQRTCSAGWLVYHPPGEVHSEKHGPTGVRALNVELEGEWLGQMLDAVGPLDQPAEFRGGPVAALAVRLVDESRRSDLDSALAVESLTWEILTACANPCQVATDTAAPRWLRDARDLLDIRAHEPLSLRRLAREAGVHPVHFAATFRRFHRMSVGEFVRRRRLEYAREKLDDQTLTMAEIAHDAGYADQSHFTRTFKRYIGVTPGQYRRARSPFSRSRAADRSKLD
jgi:AraC family transcriptional regulator